MLQASRSEPLPPGLSIRGGMSMMDKPNGPAIGPPNGPPPPQPGVPIPLPMGRSPPSGPPITMEVNWTIAF
jgi:hypothetical protein